jgi:hypothetical protein
MEEFYAASSNPVFKLVPDEFFVCADIFWTELGCPEPEFDNTWAIYYQILEKFNSSLPNKDFDMLVSL